ncbi:RNA-binding protein [Candidatus Woesearchaeota archaeon]|nr:RNA-binding protein [Candidatus Woesearchaeota archaeon]
MADKCSSCKSSLTNETGSVRFLCPSCSKYEIIRCKNCRQIVAKYTCPGCGFTGPN